MDGPQSPLIDLLFIELIPRSTKNGVPVCLRHTIIVKSIPILRFLLLVDPVIILQAVVLARAVALVKVLDPGVTPKSPLKKRSLPLTEVR